MRRSPQDSEACDRERVRNRERMRRVRQDAQVRERERLQNLARMRLNRESEEVREAERLRDAARRSRSRQVQEVRTSQRTRNTDRMRQVRQDVAIRSPERSRNTDRMRQVRQDVAIRSPEWSRNRDRMRQVRQVVAVRSSERLRNTDRMRQARQDVAIRSPERSHNTTRMRRLRENDDVRGPERVRNAVRMRNARQDDTRTPSARIQEQARRISYRLREDVRIHEQQNDTQRRRFRRHNQPRGRSAENDYQVQLKSFMDYIQRSPTFICSCCGLTFYQDSTVVVQDCELLSKLNSDFVKKILWVGQAQHRLCSTCNSKVKKGILPRLALCNGLDFSPIPEDLKGLRELEALLVSPRIPFMSIRAVGTEQQSKLFGNIVNVPNDLDTCASVLPRKFSETSVIQLQLMRRMHYNQPYKFEKIRPFHVFRAMKYLIKSELYEKSNVTLCEDWNRYVDGEVLEFVCNDNNTVVPSCPEEIDSAPGATDTLIFEDFEKLRRADIEAKCPSSSESPNITEPISTEDLLSIRRIAPGEGQTPIPLTQDQYVEELSFPTIYCGRPRILDQSVNLTYTDIARSELCRYDRRASFPTKVLYSFRKSFNEKVNQAYRICLRKKQGQNDLTAGEVCRPEVMSSILQHDEGYAVFKNVRCTPSYWQEKSKGLVAMLRQLGKCSIFLTLSAAETKWPDLLVQLKQSVDMESVDTTEAANLSHETVSRLIRSDPTLCMRHFEHRFQGFLNIMLKSKSGIFHPFQLEDYFFRTEFQARGSPHIHALLWLKDAPSYVPGFEESELKCVEFIDQFITCERVVDGPRNFTSYQLHKHTPTCFKKSRHRKICRFGFPKPPMKKTTFLLPLPEDISETEKERLLALHVILSTKLQEVGRDFAENVSFESFLLTLSMSENDYILVVRANLRRPTLMYRRNLNAIYINTYNKKILQSWAANVDIQFVTDEYACARYCASYITKPEGGASRLLQAAVQDLRQGNLSIREKLKSIANTLIRGSEVSAQEAAAFILGTSMTHCSRQVIYINTGPPSERISMLKSAEEINQLAPESMDICTKGLIDHYAQRPKELEHLCLAEFGSTYEYEKNPRNAEKNTIKDSKFRRFTLINGSGFVRKRMVSKIVRYKKYSPKTDMSNFNRTQLMLFLPWRNEVTDCIEVNQENKVHLHQAQISENRKCIHHSSEVDEDAVCRVMQDIQEVPDVLSDDDFVENGQQVLIVSEETAEDLVDEVGVQKTRFTQFLPPKVVNDEDYSKLMRSLNERQRHFVLNVLYNVNTRSDPFYFLLHGGAGVGKSHTINAIVQSVIRSHHKLASGTPEDTPVIVTAFTGKAAFNVFGMTLHTAFKLPPTQCKKLIDLSDSVLSSVRVKLRALQLLIIDEVSMVSPTLLFQIDQRLRQIRADNRPFGGIAVILVGHLYQLPPVAGRLIFQPISDSPFADLVGNPLWELFSIYELLQIKRQEGQYEFCKALNNMSEGIMDAEDVNLLQSRVIPSQFEPPPDTIHLFFTNAECKEFNDKIHASMSTEEAVSVAYDRVEGSGSRASKLALLEYAKTGMKIEKTDGLRYEVNLKISAIYFVTTNIDVQDGLFNGATGTLMYIEYGSNSVGGRIPIHCWMKFNDPLIGTNSRSKTRGYQEAKRIDVTWTRISRMTRNLKKRESDQLALIRSQIPLLAANGLTIHKSQGSTIERVAVHLKQQHRRTSRELLYVACSRASSLDGLFICGKFKPPQAKPIDPVKQELIRLRGIPLQLIMRSFQDVASETHKLYFHNIQSFPRHGNDLKADQSLQLSSFISLVETKTLPCDNVNVPGYDLIYRHDAPSRSSSQGVLLYRKVGLSTTNMHETFSCEATRTGHLSILHWFWHDVSLYALYRSPNFSLDQFRKRLSKLCRSDTKTIIFGDMNCNVGDVLTREKIADLIRLHKFDFKLNPTDPTTVAGTSIDWCIANFDVIGTVYETYYSHHKGLCITWAK